MHWLIHPGYLWLEKFDKKKLPPITTSDQFMFDKGHAFEAQARKLFPSAKLVDAKPWEFDLLVNQTKRLMEDESVETIFQATAFTDRGLLVKSDVLKRSGKTWDLYEVKSSTSVKDDHLSDLAFQAVAWEEMGVKVGDIYLLYVNKEYKRGENIEPELLVSQKKITYKVKQRIPEVEQQIPKALKVLDQKTCPDLGLEYAGNLGIWLPMYLHLNPELPPEHIYKLAQLKPEDVKLLHAGGVDSLKQVNDLEGFNARQQSQIKAWQETPPIELEKIEKFLNKLEFPLWFLDYETVSHSVPIYPGTGAYQEIPFQYSLHVLDSPGGELQHFEYLDRGDDNPTPRLLERLHQDLGGEGSILVWYQAFEMGRNSDMGELVPEYKSWMKQVNKRIVDLMIPFSKGWYIDKSFAGSASIKKVLPAIAPELSYRDLDIADGMSAQSSWYKAAIEKAPDKDKIFDDLVKYCALDTLAMVEIYRFLVELVEKGQNNEDIKKDSDDTGGFNNRPSQTSLF